jgi:hypothetical protein
MMTVEEKVGPFVCALTRCPSFRSHADPAPVPAPPDPNHAAACCCVHDLNVQPDVTYDDVGGAGEALEKLREVVELPLLHPERFVTRGIDPPKVRCPLSPPPPYTGLCTHPLYPL